MHAQHGSLILDNQSILYLARQNRRIKGYRVLVTPHEGLVYECRKEHDLNKASQLLAFHKTWILQTLARHAQKKRKLAQLKKHQQSVWILGIEKPVQILWQQSRDFFLEDKSKITLGFVAPQKSISNDLLEKSLTKILQERATRVLPVWFKDKAHKHFHYKSVKVKSMQSQWGSCSPDKRIHLNWRLVLAPPLVRDYVFVHELAHTHRMDHSLKFWQIVAKACPDYQIHRSWLKKHHSLLQIQLFANA